MHDRLCPACHLGCAALLTSQPGIRPRPAAGEGTCASRATCLALRPRGAPKTVAPPGKGGGAGGAVVCGIERGNLDRHNERRGTGLVPAGARAEEILLARVRHYLAGTKRWSLRSPPTIVRVPSPAGLLAPAARGFLFRTRIGIQMSEALTLSAAAYPSALARTYRRTLPSGALHGELAEFLNSCAELEKADRRWVCRHLRRR